MAQFNGDTVLDAADSDAFVKWVHASKGWGPLVSVWDDLVWPEGADWGSGVPVDPVGRTAGFSVSVFAASGYPDDLHCVGHDWLRVEPAWYVRFARGERAYLVGPPSWRETVDLLGVLHGEERVPDRFLWVAGDPNGLPPAPRPNRVRKTPLTDGERGRAVELYRAGRSLEDVGRVLGMSPTTVSKLVKAAGVEVRAANELKVPVPVRQEIADKYATGVSTVKLATEYGLAQSSVTEIITGCGVPMRTRGRRLNTSEREQVAAEYAAGCPSPELAERFEVSRQTVLAVVRASGGTIRGAT